MFSYFSPILFNRVVALCLYAKISQYGMSTTNQHTNIKAERLHMCFMVEPDHISHHSTVKALN